ncbi:MAG: site-2 protease family protein [Anaerolineae bacterium]|nr:site-2 protease family protein [Anaerolineae bacterium]
MKWSWKIARVAGIDIFMHTTFLILVAWVALSAWLAQRNVQAMLGGVIFLLALFACVLLHELGHALTARRYGIQTRDITLLPFGGVARLEYMPTNPIQELWVALAGPAVNFAIALALVVVLLAGGAGVSFNLSVSEGSFLQRLLAINLTLALFNLIPAFPMDGGRVVRALLATRLEYTQATHIAAALGQGIALMLGFIGLFNNPFLLFIALFVWIGAAQEASMVQVKTALGGIPVSAAMMTNFQTLSPGDTIGRAAELVLSGSQQDFPVTADGRVVGILTREDLMRALASHDEHLLVSYVMRKDFQLAHASCMLDAVSQQIQAGGQKILPVVQGGALVGLITLENIGEFLMIQRARQARRFQRA